MSKWSKISLGKFQQIEKVNADKKMSDIDKSLFIACIIFDMTEYEMDNVGPKKAAKYLNKVAKIFSSEFKPLPAKRIGKYFIDYEISNMTFGQYIELSFFLSLNQINEAHRIIASVTHTLFHKNNSDQHRKKSEYFLKQPVTKLLGCISTIVTKFTEFNKEYSDLFGLDKEVSGDVQEDKFNKRYGWIYAASQVAEYERITLEDAFKLPVRQAFNDLSYLKAKARYESEQLKQQKSYAR